MYLCNFNQNYSIRDFNRNYSIHDFNRIYSTRDFIQITKMYQNARHIKKHKKKSKTIKHYMSLHSIIFLVTQANWVVLDSLWDTCFWLRTEITCPSASPQPGTVVHRHFWITFFNGTITFDYVPCHSHFSFLLLTLFF